MLPGFGAGAPRCRVAAEAGVRDAGSGCSGLKSLRVTKYCDLQHLGLCGGDGVPCTGQADLGQDGTCLGRDGSCETRPFCLSLEKTFFFVPATRGLPSPL